MIKKITIISLLGLAASLAFAEDGPSTYTPIDYASSGDTTFDAWRTEFSRAAVVDQHISQNVVANALSGIVPDPTVVRLNNRQPEFVLPIWRYLSNAISNARIATGSEKLSQMRPILADVSAQTGVPTELAIAIWAMESNFGAIKGDMDVIRSLATLAYEGRRTALGNAELINALKIIDSGSNSRAGLVGSWAGAMGHTQFMPSSYRALAIDGDHDGKVDIWNNATDALASTLNFLHQRGWEAGVPWGAEVSLPTGFDYGLLGPTRRPLADWQNAGVKAASGDFAADFSQGPYRLLLPAGAHGPAFLVSESYEAILRYNASDAYALAVATLSDRFAGRPGIVGQWPVDDPPLGGADARALQAGLNALGYDVGTVDGIIGRGTRAGLTAFQAAHGLTPDGYPSASALAAINAALPTPAADGASATPMATPAP